MRSDEVMVNAERARFILGGSKPCACAGSATGNRPGEPTCVLCGGSGAVATPWSRSYLWAVKKAMATAGRPLGRKFLVSDVKKFLRENPDFNSKAQSGDKNFLREILDYLKNPRQGLREELIARLERRVA